MTNPLQRAPTVAVIIVTYNSGAFLPELFGSLRDLQYPSGQWGVIFIDNASTDDTLVQLREFHQTQSDITVTIQVNTQNRYFAAANNQAVQSAQQAGYEYVLLLNPDTVIDRHCVQRLIDVLIQTSAVVAQARLMLYPPESGRVNSLGNEIHYCGFGFSRANGSLWKDTRDTGAYWPITYPSGAAMMMNAQNFLTLGGFDESLEMYHEDLELGWRILEQNGAMVCVKDAIVYHKYSFYPAAYKYFFMERNRYFVLLTHYRLRTILLLAPALICVEMGVTLFSLRNGWWREKIRAHYSLLKHLAVIIQRRGHIQSRKKISDRALLNRFQVVISDQPIDNAVLRRIANPILRTYYNLISHCIYW